MSVDPVLGAIILAIFGGIGWLVKWWVARIPPRVDQSARIAQLETKQELAGRNHTEQMNALMRRFEELQATFGRQQDYIEELRVHISEGKGPPPPGWPDGLRR